ncbi:MAG TPA: diaminopimelate epimerase [Gemmatimonadaceae bacterium]|nr:diaminopimelate epimerase [Gemmatimonadaceae bacterium]
MRQAVNSGRRFYKMSGSGNDFVVFDSRDANARDLESVDTVKALSARGTGVGADGVVFLEPRQEDSFQIRYYNSDGSRGELCGNATLCALRLAYDTAMVDAEEVSIQTDSGVVTGRMAAGRPEIDFAPVSEVRDTVAEIPRLTRETCLGFARAGVPHIVILDEDVRTADILGRGSRIRRDPSLRDGANVNFVAQIDGRWYTRTYERGVEGETLACGTGAVATAILLSVWGRAGDRVTLRTRSGRDLEVRLRETGGVWHPSLRGPAEIVFKGELGDVLDLGAESPSA